MAIAATEKAVALQHLKPQNKKHLPHDKRTSAHNKLCCCAPMLIFSNHKGYAFCLRFHSA